MGMERNYSGSQNHTAFGKIQNDSRKTQHNLKQKKDSTKTENNRKIKLKFEKMQVKSRNFQKKCRKNDQNIK